MVLVCDAPSDIPGDLCACNPPPAIRTGKVLIAVLGSVTHTAAYNNQGIIKDFCFLQTIKQTIDLRKNVIFRNL